MKILLISSHLFGYMEYLADEFRRRDIEFTHFYYNEYPLEFNYKSLTDRIVFGSAKFFGLNRRKQFREGRLKEKLNDQTFDRIIVFNPHYLNAESHRFLAKISDKYITHLYDSLAKIPEQKKFTHYFDEVYSYEPKDCAENGFKFLTNFIPTTEYKSTEYKYDIFNIIGVDERFDLMQRLAAYLRAKDIRYKFLLLSKTEYSNFERIENAMKIQEVFNHIQPCKIMLDIQRPIQDGLTFRVFEAMGNDKKLITTNKNIVDYDFYDAQNILLLDPENLHIPETFLQTPFKPINPEILAPYQLHNWVDKLVS